MAGLFCHNRRDSTSFVGLLRAFQVGTDVVMSVVQSAAQRGSVFNSGAVSALRTFKDSDYAAITFHEVFI